MLAKVWEEDLLSSVMSATSTSLTTATEVYTHLHSSTAVIFTWTDVGPLTTTFTPPASCSSGVQGDLIVQASHTEVKKPCGGAPPWLSCQPSASRVSSIFPQLSAVWYFSPGFHCPAGYTTAKALTLPAVDLLYTTLGASTLATTGTHVFCCPSGYSSINHSCRTTITVATSTSACDFRSGSLSAFSFTNLNGKPQTANSEYAEPFSWTPSEQTPSLLVNINPVYMIHQQSDLPKSTVSTSDLPKSSPSTSDSSKSGLTTGDKIAIGIVVPVVVLLALALGGWFIMRRLRRRKRQRWIEESANGTGASPDTDIASGEERKDAELEGDNALEIDGRRKIAELGGRGRTAELEGRGRAAELEGRGRTAELDAREVAELEATTREDHA